MRLKCIRLAGFKSFVDPTTAYFPSNMTAVVGPNGCGKSNVIDAVRWVLGESSAKNLRGESMTDVIFNGSNTRKPISQASIELVFDNSAGGLLGEYAAYSEISVRRLVSRDGQSSYFLNGTKCRRRDITDIFLGTGLGPRSYAIIEQGMISRLVEAKPEELRIFLEEAAGISKYKERRRETENRIRRTEENLARLTDLRQELGRQVERLERQAADAKTYTELKSQERQLKAQLMALRWRALDAEVRQRDQALQLQELELERLISEQRQADALIEQYRQQHFEQNEAFNRQQALFYSVGAEVAKLEQSINHHHQQQRKLQQQALEAEQQQRSLAEELAQDQLTLESLIAELAELEPEARLQQEQVAAFRLELETLEAEQLQWQQSWEVFTEQHAAALHQADLEQNRIQQTEVQLSRYAERLRRHQDEAQLLNIHQQQQALSENVAQQTLLAEQQAELALSLEGVQEQLSQQHARIEQSLQLVEQHSAAQQRLIGQQASLQALQEAALGTDNQQLVQWLQQQQLQNLASLAEQLTVEPGWEAILEALLGAQLQSFCSTSLPYAAFASAPPESVSFIRPSTASLPAAEDELLAKVKCAYDLSPWLAGIKTADSFAQAQARLATLQAGESIVTAEGYWLGAGFIRFFAADAQQAGVLQRAQQLQALELQLQQLTQELARAKQALQQQQALLVDLEQQRQQLLATQQGLANEQAQQQAQSSILQARVEQLQQRQQQLQQEMGELEENISLEQEQLAEARLTLEQAIEQMADHTQHKQKLEHTREQLTAQLRMLRQQAQQAQHSQHQLELQLNTLRAQRQSTEQALARTAQQVARAGSRHQQLQLELAEQGDPVTELQALLEEQLAERLLADEGLREARQQLEQITAQLRQQEQSRLTFEQRVQQLRDSVQQAQLAGHELMVRRDNQQEQIQDSGFALAALLELLPASAVISDWEQELEQVAQAIERLGAINLAAIEEFQLQSARKAYLDAQDADLNEALHTLQTVIEKIDQETRQRFRDTFERVNSGLQRLFPKVFGGGNASLELTGDDLLSTGVAIMAQPPGKKNSTIHLLSGGEKALTALSLVFAIFQLNPAPFCMLDEVDAPLDDANVGRYANLVKEMSDSVQFIYITHNKIAMEKADQLLGVTMHEPGCSRLVAVNVEEAAALAES